MLVPTFVCMAILTNFVIVRGKIWYIVKVSFGSLLVERAQSEVSCAYRV